MVYVVASDKRVCHNDRGEEVACRSGRGSSSGGSWSSSSHSQTNVTRGGFGSTGSSGGG